MNFSELAKLATHLDNIGLYNMADQIDETIEKIAASNTQAQAQQRPGANTPDQSNKTYLWSLQNIRNIARSYFREIARIAHVGGWGSAEKICSAVNQKEKDLDNYIVSVMQGI